VVDAPAKTRNMSIDRPSRFLKPGRSSVQRSEQARRFERSNRPGPTSYRSHAPALVVIHKCSSTPRSHVLRGNAGLDALRPVYATLPVTRGAARLDGIPTRRVGTRKKIYHPGQRRSGVDRRCAGIDGADRARKGCWRERIVPTLRRGNAVVDAPAKTRNMSIDRPSRFLKPGRSSVQRSEQARRFERNNRLGPTSYRSHAGAGRGRNPVRNV